MAISSWKFRAGTTLLAPRKYLQDRVDPNEMSSENGQSTMQQPTEKESTAFPCSSSPAEPLKDDEAATQKMPKSRLQSVYAGVKYFITDQWFLLTLAILIAISSQVQVPASSQQIKETVVTYLCVAVIFFITGCTLATRILWENYTRWDIHLFTQIQSFLMCSASAYGVVSLCATNPDFMDPALLIGLIFLGCVPTTIASNTMMTKQAHGDHVLTLVESTVGNLIGPALSPALINMYILPRPWYTDFLSSAPVDNYAELYKRVFQQFGLSLFLPLAVGQVVQNVFPQITKKIFIEWRLSKLGMLALLILIWQTFDQAFEVGAFTSVKGNNMVFIVFISLAFYLLWTTICILLSLPWLDRGEIVTVAYVVPAKTPALGIPLAAVMFAGLDPVTQSKIQIPLVIYQGLQIACGSVFTLVLRSWIENGRAAKASKDVEKASQDSASPDG